MVVQLVEMDEEISAFIERMECAVNEFLLGVTDDFDERDSEEEEEPAESLVSLTCSPSGNVLMEHIRSKTSAAELAAIVARKQKIDVRQAFLWAAKLGNEPCVLEPDVNIMNLVAKGATIHHTVQNLPRLYMPLAWDLPRTLSGLAEKQQNEGFNPYIELPRDFGWRMLPDTIHGFPMNCTLAPVFDWSSCPSILVQEDRPITAITSGVILQNLQEAANALATLMHGIPLIADNGGYVFVIPFAHGDLQDIFSEALGLVQEGADSLEIRSLDFGHNFLLADEDEDEDDDTYNFDPNLMSATTCLADFGKTYKASFTPYVITAPEVWFARDEASPSEPILGILGFSVTDPFP